MSTSVLDLNKGRKYKPEQVEVALQVLAVTGSYAEAAATIKCTEGIVRYWRNELYTARYEQIREEIAPKLEQHAIEASRQFIVAASEKERQLLEALDPTALDQKDIPGALRNVATSKALSNDKILGPLTGRPTAVIQHRTLDQLLTDLTRRYPGAVSVIDSTAEDITASEAQQDTEPPAVTAD